jgi:hypothetical protein
MFSPFLDCKTAQITSKMPPITFKSKTPKTSSITQNVPALQKIRKLQSADAYDKRKKRMHKRSTSQNLFVYPALIQFYRFILNDF